jgi:hypothetical protein
MFGLVTFPSSGWDRRPAWIILRRHVLGMSTMSPTPFFTNQVDTVDPDTGQRLMMVQGGAGPVGASGRDDGRRGRRAARSNSYGRMRRAARQRKAVVTAIVVVLLMRRSCW